MVNDYDEFMNIHKTNGSKVLDNDRNSTLSISVFSITYHVCEFSTSYH